MKRTGSARRPVGGWSTALAASLCANPAHLAAQCPDGTPPPCRAQPARVATPTASNSVAVLYFDNLSPDTMDLYLADGLTEELITRLGTVERLRVKSRAAVARYRRVPGDPLAFGRALGVALIVNGSVRRGGGRIRATVELVRTSSGDRVWGDYYDRGEADFIAIEEDIARRVATAIAGRLLPGERAALAVRPTRDPVAYDHFVKGNYYLAQRTAHAVARAIDEYQAAVRQDPIFTQALARTAYAYALFLDWGWEYPGVSPDTLLRRGVVAVDRALQLDSTASDSWMARAYLLAQGNPHSLTAAREAFVRAITLDSGNAEAYHQYGSILGALGEDSAAAAAYGRALALDPDRLITLFQLGALRAIQRRYHEAFQWLDSALRVEPGFAYGYAVRALEHVILGDTAQALADAELAVQLGAGYPGEASLAVVESGEGDTVGASARIEKVLRGGVDSLRPDPTEGVFLGGALVALNQPERAIAFLERVRPRGWGLWYLLRLAAFDPVRSHPRFQRLVEEARPK